MMWPLMFVRPKTDFYHVFLFLRIIIVSADYDQCRSFIGILVLQEETKNMKIAINDHRKIYAIQEDFNTAFPYLKLDFYAKPHNSEGKPSEKLQDQPGKTLGECRVMHNTGEITIHGELTVAELEQRFRDVYGLTIKVSRKCGNTWLDTAMTTNWTLTYQNQQGEALTSLR